MNVQWESDTGYFVAIRLATWNVNFIRTRVDRVPAFLEREDIDALAMQEVRCRPDQFPVEPFEAASYELAIHGLNQWNGVAIAPCVGLDDVAVSLPGQPAWMAKPEAEPTMETRALGATMGAASDAAPVRLWSLYVPNGRELTHPHYTYKLDWLRVLHDNVAAWLEASPDLPSALVGDWNVAPRDEDVWDMSAFEGATHVSGPEREAFTASAEVGMREVTCKQVTNYTYWDYQKLCFPRNEGMRIDFVYASPALAGRVTDAAIDRDERKGKGASGHVPVIIEVS